MDPKWSDLEKLIRLVFGQHADKFIKAIAFIIVLYIALLLLAKIKDLLQDKFIPLFYSKEKRRLSRRRRRFAQHIEGEITRLNLLEEWSDYRFAELEAEVEVNGQWRAFTIIPFLGRVRSGKRREKSLSRAIRNSRDRLILLQGDPGSGKSVALRYVALRMANQASKFTNLKKAVPIFINLKEIQRKREEEVGPHLIKEFILKSLNRANDRDIDTFLEEEFDKGIEKGTWFFLFDSFDEIPEVLGSTEADTTIQAYSQAIHDFMHGMNQCRGVVASRHFRGPRQTGWPKFVIQPLSGNRRLKLIRRAELPSKTEQNLIGNLSVARDEILSMINNPMFLGLLCEYMKTNETFPENVHTVFKAYVETRLERDQDRIRKRFHLSSETVRGVSERVAFCMSADSHVGLSPNRNEIAAALRRNNFKLPKNLDIILDALEYIKLARSETATTAGESRSFTFAHRRFQEYFATSVVLKHPELVTPHQLLTDASWRETAVTLCQTQPIEDIQGFLEEAEFHIIELSKGISFTISDPIAFVESQLIEQEKRRKKSKEDILLPVFKWPVGLIHVLALLQDAFTGRSNLLPDGIQFRTSLIVLEATKTGNLFDRKWALEVSGISYQEVLSWLLESAYSINSQWLQDVAYQQAARLRQLPPKVARSIRKALQTLALSGRLRKEFHATNAHLSRFEESREYLNIVQQLKWAFPIDIGLNILVFLWVFGTRLLNFGTVDFTHPLALSTIALIILLIMTWSGKDFLYAPGTFFRGFLSLFFAIGVVVILVLAVDQGINPFSFYRWLFVLLSFFAITWSLPVLFVTAPTGQFTHPWWWILAPLTPILFLLFNIKGGIISIKNWLKYSWKEALAIILMGLVILVVFLNFQDLSIWIQVPTLIVLVILSGFVLYGIFIVLFFLIQSILDWFKYWYWVLSSKDTLDEVQFIEVLRKFRTAPTKFIRRIRIRNVVYSTEVMENMLLVISLLLEHRIIHQGEITPKVASDIIENKDDLPLEINQWLEKELQLKIPFRHYTIDCLDEINMLIEHVQLKQKRNPSPTR